MIIATKCTKNFTVVLVLIVCQQTKCDFRVARSWKKYENKIVLIQSQMSVRMAVCAHIRYSRKALHIISIISSKVAKNTHELVVESMFDNLYSSETPEQKEDFEFCLS